MSFSLHHYERELVINNRQLHYKGIFRVNELFKTINDALHHRNYHPHEKKSEEVVTEEGKKFYLELRPKKSVTNYAKLLIKIKLSLDNVTEVPEVVDGDKHLFQKGTMNIVFDAWVLTEYDHRWGMKPFVYFVKGLINKFFYKWPLEDALPGTVSEDTAYVFSAIKKLLKSYKKEVGTFTSEEAVMKEIEGDILKN